MISISKIKIILSILLSVQYTPILSEVFIDGHPYLKKIDFGELDQGSYPWKIIWDSDNVPYISRDKIWRWNGSSWSIDGPENLQTLRDLKFSASGELWVTGYNSIGYFNTNNFEYISIVDWIPPEYQSFGESWEIHLRDNYVWVSTHNKLMKISQDEFHIWEFTSNDRVIFFFLNCGIYAHVPSEGIWKISDKEKELICSEDALTKRAILFMEEMEGSTIRCISGDQIVEFDATSGQMLKNIHFKERISGLSSIAKLPSGNYAIGSLGRGFKFLKPSGEFYSIFDEESELGRLVVLYMATDYYGNLWILHTKGLLLLNEEIRVYHLKNNQLFDGIIRSVNYNNDRLLFGSSTGLKELKQINNSFDSYCEIVDTEINQIRIVKGEVLFDGYNSIFVLEEIEARKRYNFDKEITTFDYTGRGHMHVAFIGSVTSYRDKSGGELQELNEFETPVSLQQMETDGEGVTWGWTEKSPLYEMRVDRHDEVDVIEHKSISGARLAEINSQISITDAGPVIAGRDSITQRDPVTGEWHCKEFSTGMGDPLASEFITTGIGLEGWMAYWDEQKSCNLLVRVEWPAGGEVIWEILPWLDMKELGRIYKIKYIKRDNPILMIIGMKGILMAHPQLCESIPIPGKPVIWHSSDNSPVPPSKEWKFNDQGDRFVFGSPGRELYYPVRYQTRIVGLDDEWSEATAYADKEIGQLLAGSYRFEVRAVDPFNRFGETSGIDLVIYPPWYKTIWAYFLYTGIFILLLTISMVLYERLRVYKIQIRQAELERLVSERTRELKKANAIKDDFIANLSHEIRNPLNGVIGLIRELKEGMAPRDDNIRALKSAANYLHGTVEDVLDFAKLETGEITIARSTFDIDEMAAGVIQIYRQHAEDKGVVVEHAIWNPENQLIISDEGKVQQILANLVNNAVKFTDSGFIQVELGVFTDGEQPNVIIRVKDSGRGISESDLPKVFDKFYQVQSGDHKVSGTGLGLALVKAFTDRLYGELEIHSEVGMGTEVIVSIPVTVSEKNAVQEIPMEKLGLSVLVVEDLEYNRLHIEQFLKTVGCDVQSADDGLIALDMARNNSYDVILLDWELPGLKGLEIAKSLRSDPEFDQNTRIFSMTAYTSKAVQDKCIKAGMNAFLSKPFNSTNLYRELIRRYIIGAGNLADMDYDGDWEGHKNRWFGILKAHVDAVEYGFENSNIESVTTEAHKLLGHLRMICTVEIGDCLLDLMTAAKADDLAGARMEWEHVIPMLDWLRKEFEWL